MPHPDFVAFHEDRYEAIRRAWSSVAPEHFDLDLFAKQRVFPSSIRPPGFVQYVQTAKLIEQLREELKWTQ